MIAQFERKINQISEPKGEATSPLRMSTDLAIYLHLDWVADGCRCA